MDCAYCDSTFQNRIELEYHVEQEHAFARSSVKIRL